MGVMEMLTWQLICSPREDTSIASFDGALTLKPHLTSCPELFLCLLLCNLSKLWTNGASHSDLAKTDLDTTNSPLGWKL